jgi:dihydrofolate synthase/folylpolyglutamate synthase
VDYLALREYLKRFPQKMGTEAAAALLKELGSPEKAYPIIHIAGTNGKGSTAVYIASILTEAGYKTGVFSSPAVYDYAESFKLSGEKISESEFTEVAERVIEKADAAAKKGGRHASAFETETAIALQWFKENKADLAVVEAGMGGRLDATNAVEKTLMTVFSEISLDHTAELGGTIEEIAKEKAGIIKDGGIVITGESAAAAVIKAEAEKRKARYIEPEKAEVIGYQNGKLSFRLSGSVYQTSMLGLCQPKNAALAVAAVGELRRAGYKIAEDDIARGIAHANIEGRFERVLPDLVLDGGHNPAAVSALADTLKAIYPKEKFIFMFGMFKDKDWQSCARIIAPPAKKVYAVSPEGDRGLNNIILRDYLSGLGVDVCAEDVESAVKLALFEEGIKVCCGSFSILAKAKKAALDSPQANSRRKD